jgi:hypothetical protein
MAGTGKSVAVVMIIVVTDIHMWNSAAVDNPTQLLHHQSASRKTKCKE